MIYIKKEAAAKMIEQIPDIMIGNVQICTASYYLFTFYGFNI